MTGPPAMNRSAPPGPRQRPPQDPLVEVRDHFGRLIGRRPESSVLEAQQLGRGELVTNRRKTYLRLFPKPRKIPAQRGGWHQRARQSRNAPSGMLRAVHHPGSLHSTETLDEGQRRVVR
jgi:hypothetical protein